MIWMPGGDGGVAGWPGAGEQLPASSASIRASNAASRAFSSAANDFHFHILTAGFYTEKPVG
jgi:hypothetical protein